MVKTILIIISVISIIILGGGFILGHTSKAGKAPGLILGALSACPDTPNCVSSEGLNDASHSIPPLQYPATMTEDRMSIIKDVIQEIGGKISTQEEEYIAATFTSGLFRFVDDVECRNDGAKHTQHLRSASRVGHSDFGANRKRVAIISSLFHERVKRVHQAIIPQKTKSISNS